MQTTIFLGDATPTQVERVENLLTHLCLIHTSVLNVPNKHVIIETATLNYGECMCVGVEIGKLLKS